MFRLVARSIRVKSVLAGLVPFLLVLAAVGFIGVRAYDRVARDVVTQRDAELARVTGERLSERLKQEARLLQELAEDERVRSLESDGVRLALDQAAGGLRAFDAGIIVYNWTGVLVGASPPSAERAVTGTRDESSRLLNAVQATRRPAFSDVFRDLVTGENAILIGVPIRGIDDEFGGMLVGVANLRTSLLGVVFAAVLEFRGGRSGLAYLVDSRGRVIYHRDLFRVGTDLSALPPVERVLTGETDALISDDPAGTEVVAGFAPVPGTGWGVITQERWNLITGPIRASGLLLLVMLGGGALLSAALVFVAIGRTLRPIRQLTRGARRIAGGDFDHRIGTDTDVELRELAEQFNEMAAALRDSYADLEGKVAARTEESRLLMEQAQERAEEIAAVNLRTTTVADVAAQVTSILSLDELLPYVTNLMCDAFGYQTVYIFLVEANSQELLLRTRAGGQGQPIPDEYRLPVGEGISGWVAQHGEAVLANDVSADPRYMPVSWNETKAYLAVPIRSADRVVGVIGIEQNEVDAFDETDQFTAQTLADCLGVAIDNAHLFEQAGDVAVLQERNRMAREIHDTLAQGFTGIVLQLEAADQAMEDGAEQPVVSRHLDRARDLARDSLNEARRSVWNLLPRALDGRALDDALAQEVGQFAALGREVASFSLTGVQRSLPTDVGAALLRICQESLTNVRKHAEATAVTVELEFREADVVLRVADDGKGFELAGARQEARSRGGGLGIAGMEQRTGQLDGALTVRSGANGGTLVEATVPLAPRAAAAG